MLNVAVTDLAAFIVTEQVPVPEQAPDQPAKVALALGVAVRVSTVPVVKPAEQVAPQVMPAGLDVTVPLPEPLLVTDSVGLGGAVPTLKVAVTDFTASMVTLQVPAPEQAPDQPAKVEPKSGVAVRVTKAPWEYLAEHVPPQVMPLG
jgi:hypothetical protein